MENRKCSRFEMLSCCRGVIGILMTWELPILYRTYSFGRYKIIYLRKSEQIREFSTNQTQSFILTNQKRRKLNLINEKKNLTYIH